MENLEIRYTDGTSENVKVASHTFTIALLTLAMNDGTAIKIPVSRVAFVRQVKAVELVAENV